MDHLVHLDQLDHLDHLDPLDHLDHLVPLSIRPSVCMSQVFHLNFS